MTIRALKKRFRQRRHAGAIILMYHRISDVAPLPNWLGISPDHFRQQMEFIRAACQPISLHDLADGVRNDALPSRAVAVTFDDGYANNYTEALPILDTLDIPATVFASSGFIDSPREFWWDELHRHLLWPLRLPTSLSLEIAGKEYRWDMRVPQDRRFAYQDLTEHFRPLSLDEQERIMSSLAEWSGVERDAHPAFRALTSTELVELAGSSVIEIGAHTVTHPILPTLTSDKLVSEIAQSKADIETLLGQPVRAFAYPDGRYCDRTLRVVEQSGFTVACTTEPGCILADDPIFELKRCNVCDWDVLQFQFFLEQQFASA